MSDLSSLPLRKRTRFPVGATAYHLKFGEGTVVMVDGEKRGIRFDFAYAVCPVNFLEAVDW